MATETLTNNSIRILADLIRAKRPLPIRRIADRSGIHWKTANEHIWRLEKRGFIKCERTKRRTYCAVEPSFLRQIKRP